MSTKIKSRFFVSNNIEELNINFVHYLNYGGYPEVIFSERIQSDPGRFVKSDIIDKVLLRDLPGLYGVQDIQELNYLYSQLLLSIQQMKFHLRNCLKNLA
jgi:predicted AAA+ superfamily ATPase